MTSPSDTYLADTHALVWFLLEDRKLPARASRLLQAAERGELNIIVPTVVLAEGVAIEEKGRLNLPKGRILDWVLTHPSLIVADFDLSVLVRMQELAMNLELHDRMIAATALLYGATVITRDRMISRVVDTMWE